jgi:hypothetical protein
MNWPQKSTAAADGASSVAWLWRDEMARQEDYKADQFGFFFCVLCVPLRQNAFLGRIGPGCVNFAQSPALFLFFEGDTSRYCGRENAQKQDILT